jgi:hypothetical protein
METARRWLLIGVVLLSAYQANAQQRARHGLVGRYLQKLLNDTTDKAIPQFRAYPTLAFAPETSWELGISSVFVFYANRDTTNRLSEVNAFTFVTLQEQYGLWFDHALYSQANRWFFLGRLRFQDFPLYYHGVGPTSPREPVALVNNHLVQIKERVLREVHRSIYAGVELDYQRASSVNFIPQGEPLVNLPAGATGSANLGLGLGLLYDNRHNILNVRDGFFSEVAFLSYRDRWGSDFNFNTVLSDTRFFRPIRKRNVLAAQLLGQFTVGQAPFNQLALIGGESMLRGYYSGRYRDRNLVAAQVEYRMLPLPLGFTKRWGAAVFAAAGNVFNRASEITLDRTHWSAGGGVRFLIFPKKDIYTRLDVAFTPEGRGVYIYIGEAF